MDTDSTAIEQLEARLERGWELIERAKAADDDQSAFRFTRHWLELLADYERLCEPAGPAPEQESPS